MGELTDNPVGELCSVWASLSWASLLVGEFTGYHLYTTYLPLAIKQRTISDMKIQQAKWEPIQATVSQEYALMEAVN